MDDHPGVDAECKRIQHIPHNCGLDELDVLDGIGDGKTIPGVGFRVGNKHRERDIVAGLVHHDFVGSSHRADPSQFGDSVPVVILAEVTLGIEHLSGCLADLGLIGENVGSGQTCLAFGVRHEFMIGPRIFLHFLPVIPHLHQFTDREVTPVPDEIGILGTLRIT